MSVPDDRIVRALRLHADTEVMVPPGFAETLLAVLDEEIHRSTEVRAPDPAPYQCLHDPARPRRRFSAIGAAAVAFVAVLAIGAIAALIASMDPRGGDLAATDDNGANAATSIDAPRQTQEPITPAQSGTPNTTDIDRPSVSFAVPTEHSGFEPTPELTDGVASVEATFTDGKTVTITYPATWQLERQPWRPSTTLTMELRDAPRGGWSYFPASVVFNHAARSQASTETRTERSIVIDEWTVVFLVDEDLWTASDIETLLTSTGGVVDPNGFPVLTTEWPIAHLTDDPDQRSSLADYLPSTILVGDVAMFTSWCQTDEIVAGPESITWCDPTTDIGITVWAPPDVHHIVRSSLTVSGG